MSSKKKASCCGELETSYSSALLEDVPSLFFPQNNPYADALQTHQNELEAQWSVFFSAWGLPLTYISESETPELYPSSPSFQLANTPAWIELRPLSEASHYSDILESFAPFVYHTRTVLLVLFGPPKLRLPEAQGWSLQIYEGELVMTPIHLTECQGCGGFSASGIGSPEDHHKRPEYFKQIHRLATTDKLMEAYKQAQSTHMWLH